MVLCPAGFHTMTDRSSGCQGSARPHREDARVIQFETRMAIGRTELVRVRLEGIQPVLRVENMQAALRFHLDFLGFQNANWGTEEFTRRLARWRSTLSVSGPSGKERGVGGLAWMMSAGSMRN